MQDFNRFIQLAAKLLRGGGEVNDPLLITSWSPK